MEYQTDAVLLGVYDRGEDSRVFSILSPDFGRLHVVGQGTKKIKSKLNGHMQFFSIVHIGIARGKKNNQLINALLARRFGRIAESYEKRIVALTCCELLYQLTDESDETAPLYDALIALFDALNTMTYRAETAKSLFTRFCYHVLEHLGYAPDQKHKNDFNYLSQHCQKILNQPIQSLAALRSILQK